MIIVLPKWTESPVVRVLSGFGFIVIVLVFCAWYYSPGERTVPDTLIGEWVSSDTRYDDRVFEIDPISVNFGTPGSKVSVGYIKSVTAEPDGAKTLYTISYVANNMPSQISFYYDTEHGESIYFKNRQSIVWTKRPKL